MAPKVTIRKRLTVRSGARPAPSPDRPRPWKSSDAAAAARGYFRPPGRDGTLHPAPGALKSLLQELCSGDPFEHRCAAEVARLVSRRKPGVLADCADLLAEVAATFPVEEWQARGYVLVAAAQSATKRAQRIRLLPLVRARLADDRIAVRAMALEAFALLSVHEPDLRDEALEMLEAARHDAAPALRSRAKLMLPVVTALAKC